MISVKDGRTAGLGAQHCSIKVLHSGSQELGMVGLNVLLTMPPVHRQVLATEGVTISECMTRNIAPVEQVYYCFIGMKALNYIDKWDGIPRGWGKF